MPEDRNDRTTSQREVKAISFRRHRRPSYIYSQYRRLLFSDCWHRFRNSAPAPVQTLCPVHKGVFLDWEQQQTIHVCGDTHLRLYDTIKSLKACIVFTVSLKQAIGRFSSLAPLPEWSSYRCPKGTPHMGPESLTQKATSTVWTDGKVWVFSSVLLLIGAHSTKILLLGLGWQFACVSVLSQARPERGVEVPWLFSKSCLVPFWYSMVNLLR